MDFHLVYFQVRQNTLEIYEEVFKNAFSNIINVKIISSMFFVILVFGNICTYFPKIRIKFILKFNKYSW